MFKQRVKEPPGACKYVFLTNSPFYANTLQNLDDTKEYMTILISSEPGDSAYTLDDFAEFICNVQQTPYARDFYYLPILSKAQCLALYAAFDARGCMYSRYAWRAFTKGADYFQQNEGELLEVAQGVIDRCEGRPPQSPAKEKATEGTAAEEKAKTSSQIVPQSPHQSNPMASKNVSVKPTKDGYAPASEKPESCLIRMADIEPKEISWLWEPYIPLGKITLLRGDPGQGKTTLCLTLAAIVSKGLAFPTDSSFTASEQGSVLFITAEDDLSDTIAPRLIKAKANTEKVFSYRESPTEALTFTSTQFETLIKEAKPRLVIVDPIQAFLGSQVDGHRANEIRPVMSRIRALAEQYNCAVVLIEHMNKNLGGKGLYRGLGSIDITAAARSIIMLGSDPENEAEKGIAHIKCNVGKMGPVVGFTIGKDGLVWNPHTTLTADMIQGHAKPAGVRSDSALDEAKEFLMDALKEGKQSSRDILITAKQYGISERTLKRAREDLSIDCKESKGFGSGTIVYWKLPDLIPAGKMSKAEALNIFNSSEGQIT